MRNDLGDPQWSDWGGGGWLLPVQPREQDLGFCKGGKQKKGGGNPGKKNRQKSEKLLLTSAKREKLCP